MIVFHLSFPSILIPHFSAGVFPSKASDCECNYELAGVTKISELLRFEPQRTNSNVIYLSPTDKKY